MDCILSVWLSCVWLFCHTYWGSNVYCHCWLQQNLSCTADPVLHVYAPLWGLMTGKVTPKYSWWPWGRSAVIVCMTEAASHWISSLSDWTSPSRCVQMQGWSRTARLVCACTTSCYGPCSKAGSICVCSQMWIFIRFNSCALVDCLKQFEQTCSNAHDLRVDTTIWLSGLLSAIEAFAASICSLGFFWQQHAIKDWKTMGCCCWFRRLWLNMSVLEIK